MSTQSSSFSILPPDAKVEGKSISKWTEDWWTWAAQSPAATSPLDDTTGEWANQNNHGPVFFVAGTDGSLPSAERTFHVDANTPLLVPLLNTFDTGGVLPPHVPPFKPTDADSYINSWLGDVKDVFATIDGVPVSDPKHYLETTQVFSMGRTRADTWIANLGAEVGSQLVPTKATGYYLMIELSKGTHTIDFGGTLASGFSTHVTDHIIVS